MYFTYKNLVYRELFFKFAIKNGIKNRQGYRDFLQGVVSKDHNPDENFILE